MRASRPRRYRGGHARVARRRSRRVLGPLAVLQLVKKARAKERRVHAECPVSQAGLFVSFEMRLHESGSEL